MTVFPMDHWLEWYYTVKPLIYGCSFFCKFPSWSWDVKINSVQAFLAFLKSYLTGFFLNVLPKCLPCAGSYAHLKPPIICSICPSISGECNATKLIVSKMMCLLKTQNLMPAKCMFLQYYILAHLIYIHQPCAGRITCSVAIAMR